MEEQVEDSLLSTFINSPFAFQLYHINAPNNVQNLILQLVDQHKKVYQEIEDLYKRHHHPASLTQQLTRTVERLVRKLHFSISLSNFSSR